MRFGLSVRASRRFGDFRLALSEQLNISIGEISPALHIPENILREKASAREMGAVHGI